MTMDAWTVLQAMNVVRCHRLETARPRPTEGHHIARVLVLMDLVYRGRTPPEVTRRALGRSEELGPSEELVLRTCQKAEFLFWAVEESGLGNKMIVKTVREEAQRFHDLLSLLGEVDPELADTVGEVMSTIMEMEMYE